MPIRWTAVSWIAVTLAAASGFAPSTGSAQSARDELRDWPLEGFRPMAVRGPAAAPAPPEPPLVAIPPIHAPPREIVDHAVAEAAYFGPGAGHGDLPPTIAEASPSDRLLPLAEPLATDLPAEHPAIEPNVPSIGQPLVGSTSGSVTPRPARSVEGDRRLLGARLAAPMRPVSEGRSSLSELTWDSFSNESLTTTGAALAIVLGLVMLMAWVWRRAAPRSTRPLPEDVVSIVGRVPLAGKQVAQLIKIGGKLVLVSLTPEGAKPLTEITDPQEVARLLGLCEQASPHSATAAFRDVFDEITREPASPGFLGDEAPLLDRQKLADAYANTPGGRAFG
ncbi:MAG: flagellar biosynthetic protein FliO [Planctomycetota bacterium]